MKSMLFMLGLFALIAIPLVAADIGQCGGGMMGGMMYGMYGGYGGSMMLFSWLTWLLVIALIIATIYWLIKNANRKR